MPLQTGYLAYSVQILPFTAGCACVQLWDAPYRTTHARWVVMKPFSLLSPLCPAVPLSSYPATKLACSLSEVLTVNHTRELLFLV